MSHSFLVTSSEVTGYSPIYRHPKFKDGTHNKEFADIKNLYDLFTTMVANNPKKEFLGKREYFPETNTFGDYKWMTTTDAAEYVDDLGAGLDSIYAAHAPEPNKTTGQQVIGVLALGRPEWLLTELAAFRSRRYVVGISDYAGIVPCEHVVNFADTRVIVCSMDKIPRMLDRMDKTPNVKVIISMDKLDCSRPSITTQAFSAETTEKLQAKAESLGVVLMDLDQVIELGKANPTEPTLPSEDDLCSISFTSGTTGSQKGAMLSHKSLLFSAKASRLHVGIRNTTYLSYMSLVYVFEHSLIYMQMFGSVRIGYFTGEKSRIMEDMQTLRPTLLTFVPPALNRFYESIVPKTIGAKGLKGFLCRMAYKSKEKRIKSGRGFKHSLWDKLVFNKVAQVFGGRAELMICGGSALAPEMQDFMRVGLSCNVIQGYGQTETSAASLCQTEDNLTTGNCGIPLPGVDVRLRSIPDMGYNVTDLPCPRGELMIRSNLVTDGYYQEPEKTAELMEDGWMVSGDIATINADGTVTIFDRIRNTIRTAVMTFMEPGPLEMIYSSHELVKDCFVYGSSNAYKLVAVVVPNPDTFIPWARNIAKNQKAELEELCENKKVAEALTEALFHLASRSKVPSLAMIGAIHLEPKPFEQVNSEFYTSSLKLRRPMVNQHYMTIFDNLVKSIDTTSNFKTKEASK
ncbi:medium-chain fatty acid-CoA ligase faa2 [Coemansia sp. RSA 1722]|nr:medium-chain fatty acid-CoA ligase faa2 [Coemansia sp. RSA 485]KAJ2604163.1 medium-chain fatty acid-CoA ligase faa2 [Coemansia sp. RSA 1722]